MSDAMPHVDTPARAEETSTAEEDHAVDVQKHIKVYMVVFGSLAVLTVVTVAVAYLNLSIVPAVVVALFIASIKGGLVAGYFMHLVSERKVIYYLLVATGIFLLAMFILFSSAYYSQDGEYLVP